MKEKANEYDTFEGLHLALKGDLWHKVRHLVDLCPRIGLPIALTVKLWANVNIPSHFKCERTARTRYPNHLSGGFETGQLNGAGTDATKLQSTKYWRSIEH